jgi:hypothetical protein
VHAVANHRFHQYRPLEPGNREIVQIVHAFGDRMPPGDEAISGALGALVTRP